METESEMRLRRQKDAVNAYREIEDQARVELARAVENTRAAKARYDELFLAEEMRLYREGRS